MCKAKISAKPDSGSQIQYVVSFEIPVVFLLCKAKKKRTCIATAWTAPSGLYKGSFFFSLTAAFPQRMIRILTASLAFSSPHAEYVSPPSVHHRLGTDKRAQHTNPDSRTRETAGPVTSLERASTHVHFNHAQSSLHNNKKQTNHGGRHSVSSSSINSEPLCPP